MEAANPEVSNLEAECKLECIPVEACMKEKADWPGRPQVLINKTANLIELGLDKIGDGIIALGEKIAGVTSNISRFVPQK